MSINLLILFIALNVINVILQTIKSIATVKCKPFMAAVINAIAYGLYTVVLVYTVCDLPLWVKVAVTALANLVGVYVVKVGEVKSEKDKLWKVEATVPTCHLDAIDFDLRTVPHSYIQLSDKHTLFNFYCATQAESRQVKDIINQYDAKYFVAESKVL